MTSRRPPARHAIRVERVVVTGVPAAQLDTAAVSRTLQAMIAQRLIGGRPIAGRPAATSGSAPTVRVTWAPGTGEQALAEALADGIDVALRTVRRE